MSLTTHLSPSETLPSKTTEGGALPSGRPAKASERVKALGGRGRKAKGRGSDKPVVKAVDVEGSVRKCLVTGEVKPKDQLIRFVAGPDGVVIPDVAAKLPGRGLWVSATREAIESAASKGLFSKAAKQKVKAAPDLLETLDKLLTRRCLEFLGLARGCGACVTGEAQVAQGRREDALSYIILSADAGADILKKTTQATRILSGFSRVQLGEAVGRGSCVALGLKPGPLSEKLRVELLRWQGVSCSQQSLSDAQNSISSIANNPECGKND